MKMNFLFVSVILLLSSQSVTCGSELDYDGWLQLRLWHALNDEPIPIFTERGNITVSSIRSGASVIGQNGLLQHEIFALKKLAANDGQYRLKAIARTSSGGETIFLTSVPAASYIRLKSWLDTEIFQCHLLGSDLEDNVMIWLHSGADPIAVSLSSPGPCSMDKPFTNMWTTNVIVKYPDGGPVPDTATYIQKLESEREARERGETKDNRSFLMKYWMYIVPAVIFVFLTSATNPEADGGAGSGSAQRQ